MEDKEEDISWLFLWGATILYTLLACMVFAALVAMKPTLGDAFLNFTKDYGALLAGIPVLIAVLVAKQQLDANRRQHVATVKRSFIDKIEAIEKARFYFNIFIRNTELTDLENNPDPEEDGLDFWKIDQTQLAIFKRHLSQESYSFLILVKELMSEINFKYVCNLHISGEMIDDYRWVQAQAHKGIFLVEGEYNNISQYWS